MGVSKGYQPNTFRAISGSLFSTAGNWSRGYVPTGSDVAVIADNCRLDINRIIGTLKVLPGYTASINTGVTFQVTNVLEVLGHLSCSGTPTIVSYAPKNVINTISPGSSSFIYGASVNQNVAGGTYYYLGIGTGDLGIPNVTATKTATGDITTLSDFRVSGFPGGRATMNLGRFNLTVSGSSSTTAGRLTKNQTGSLVFIGRYDAGNIDLANDFPGNPTIDFRTGIAIAASNPSPNAINSGVGTWRFLNSPNQYIGTWSSIFPSTIDAPIIIGSGVNLLLRGSGFNPATDSALYINSVVNGTDSSSKLALSGSLYFGSVASLNSMTTGTFDFTSSNATLGFGGNYTATIPSRFNTFRNLLVFGTGTKTLGTSSFVSGDLTINSGGTLDLGIFNIDVDGTTTVVGNLNKTGAGNVLFRGTLALQNSASPKVNFSASNPNVELRGGISYGNGADPINSGTGTWTFTTNNQSITHVSSLGPTVTFNCPMVVSGAITLTNAAAQSSTVVINNSLNGTQASSRFVNSHVLSIANASFPQPMTTGIFDITSSANTLIYSFNGNYTIPYAAFSSLTIIGSGSKTLSANTAVSGNLSLSFGTLQLSTYDLIVSGTTTITNTPGLGVGTISKNGPGNILFMGQLVSPSGGEINFSGNPNVEFRNGFTYLNTAFTNTGTGSWNFTTNNQVLSNAAGNPGFYVISASILISGITLGISSSNPAHTLTLTNTLNGSNPSSTLLMGSNTILIYNNSSQPMATGVLNTSTNLNTFIYGTGSQDIKGGTYRNLTLLSGSKTLQGNVSVLGTFSTGSGIGSASVNLNGFTLTNP